MNVGRNVVHGVLGFVGPSAGGGGQLPGAGAPPGSGGFRGLLAGVVAERHGDAARSRVLRRDAEVRRRGSGGRPAQGSRRRHRDVASGLRLRWACWAAQPSRSWLLRSPDSSRSMSRLAAIVAFRLAALQFMMLLPAWVFVSVAKAIGRFDRSALFASLLSVATYGGAVVAVLAGAGLVGAMAGYRPGQLRRRGCDRHCRCAALPGSRHPDQPGASRRLSPYRGFRMGVHGEFHRGLPALSDPEIRGWRCSGAGGGHGHSNLAGRAVENARRRECRHRSDVPVLERFPRSCAAAASLPPHAGGQRADGIGGLCRAGHAGTGRCW